MKLLFGFDYVWEVYKPAKDRRWGWYVVPLLHRGRFVGRLDARIDAVLGAELVRGRFVGRLDARFVDGRIRIDRRWVEEGEELDERAFEEALHRHERALGGAVTATSGTGTTPASPTPSRP